VTLQEDAERLNEAMLNLVYEFAKAVGIIALVKRIRFLKLRDWVQEREDRA
jgi:hypothetical protein